MRSLSKESYQVRIANSFERSLFDPKPKEKKKSIHPEKSKYWDLWCQISEMLTSEDDVIVESSELSYYEFVNLERGLRKLVSTLRENGRIDFNIATVRMAIYKNAEEEEVIDPTFQYQQYNLQVKRVS